MGREEKEVIEDGFNPWSVEDLSFFLRYCCPECDFSDHNLKSFTEHALEKHLKSKSFFTPENIAEHFGLDGVIKPEEPESFNFENYDLEQPDPYPDLPDDFLDVGENKIIVNENFPPNDVKNPDQE